MNGHCCKVTWIWHIKTVFFSISTHFDLSFYILINIKSQTSLAIFCSESQTMSFVLVMNFKMLTIVGILMTRTNFMLI